MTVGFHVFWQLGDCCRFLPIVPTDTDEGLVTRRLKPWTLMSPMQFALQLVLRTHWCCMLSVLRYYTSLCSHVNMIENWNVILNSFLQSRVFREQLVRAGFAGHENVCESQFNSEVTPLKTSICPHLVQYTLYVFLLQSCTDWCGAGEQYLKLRLW